MIGTKRPPLVGCAHARPAAIARQNLKALPPLSQQKQLLAWIRTLPEVAYSKNSQDKLG